MGKFVIWKIIDKQTTYLPAIDKVYVENISVTIDRVLAIISSLEDKDEWEEVSPIGVEDERWENKKGDRIFIRDQTLPSEKEIKKES